MTTLLDIRATLTDTNAVTVLDDMIARIVDAVERELDWYFRKSRPAIEMLDGTGTRALWLRQPPLDGVTVQTRTGIGESWSIVPNTEYESSGRGLFNAGNWTEGIRNYRVSYNEGFLTMPGDIEQLILDLVVLHWERRGTDPGLRSETIGDYSYTRADLEESEYWRAVVMRWRRGRI